LRKKMIVALARKLLIALWHFVRNDHSQSAFVLGAVKDFAGGANAPSLTAPARDGLTRPVGRDEETGLSRSNKETHEVNQKSQ
jgi:hypothetical protein